MYDKSEKADEPTRALILEVIAVINGVTEAQLQPRFQQPTIPLSEVDTRMSGIKSKLLDVIGDHEVWKSTFGGLKTLEDKTLGGILDALKQALANNCENVRAAVKENDHLRLQLRLDTAPVEERVLALSAFEGMGIAAIEPPIKSEIETQCKTAKLILSSPRDFSEDEKEHFRRMMDTNLNIPPVERSDTESGNGRVYRIVHRTREFIYDGAR
jgi:hypothetical protein